MTNICLFNTTTGCPPLCDDQSPCSSICNNKGVSIERPWSRFNFVCQSTEFDRLQMRRKAEVLQYKNNSSKLTKKQRYSLAAKNLLTNDSFSIHHWGTTWMETNKLKKFKFKLKSIFKLLFK